MESISHQNLEANERERREFLAVSKAANSNSQSKHYLVHFYPVGKETVFAAVYVQCMKGCLNMPVKRMSKRQSQDFSVLVLPPTPGILKVPSPLIISQILSLCVHLQE